jgi:hypothetical protein
VPRLFAARRGLLREDEKSGTLSDAFATSEPVHDALFMSRGAGFKAVIHSDHLAAGPDRVKAFALTNVGGRGSTVGEKGEIIARSFPSRAVLRWSFVCQSIRMRWYATEGLWLTDEEREECTLDVAFREPFQALARRRGDGGYYFLTTSGRLFRAPPPVKGKRHREVVPVWDDPRSPITAIMTDADGGRTFLFLDRGPKGVGGPFVFEMADGVRLRPYDPKLFREGEQGPLQFRRVVGFARVLVALGYVSDAAPPAPKAKAKDGGR